MMPNESLIAAYECWSVARDALCRDPARYGKYVVVSAGGDLIFSETFREAFMAAREQDLLGRALIQTVYPFEDRRGQLLDPHYQSGGDLGFTPPRLFVSSASIVGAQASPAPCDFCLDTGSEITLVPVSVLDEVKAPVVTLQKIAGAGSVAGGGAVGDGTGRVWTWRGVRLVGLTNGSTLIRLDPWAVAETDLRHGVLGRDVLSRCRIRYPVDGDKFEIVQER